MKKLNIFLIILLVALMMACGAKKISTSYQLKDFKKTFVDPRDQSEYGIVEIGNHIWFAQHLNFKTPKSVCYKKKEKNCNTFGRLYPSDELDIACPKGWRVPNIKDWNELKSYFLADSIYALMDTVNWKNNVKHTNESGLSLGGAGYQMEKKLFLGQGAATSLWLNQFNKFDEYYHVHIYGGRGINFPKSKYQTNEVFHAHPITDLKNRRLSIRCVCDKKKKDNN